MLENTVQSLKNYILSDYDCDRQQSQGRWKNRLINLIDIPSEALKTVVGTSALLTVALYKVSAAGFSVTFKVIPKTILSCMPYFDKNYWEDRSATHWDETEQHLTQFKRYAIYGVTYFISHFVISLLNIAGCTIAPNCTRDYRIDNAISFRSFMAHSTIEKFYRDAGITTKEKPIQFDTSQLDPSLKMPMEEIVEAINNGLFSDNQWDEVIADPIYHLLAPQSLPPQRFVYVARKCVSMEDIIRRGSRFEDYSNKRPGDTTETVDIHNADRKTTEETIIGQCLKQLVEAKAIYSYDRLGRSFFVQA